jgi:hypothetical protein
MITFEPSQKNPFERKPSEKAEDHARMLSSLQKTATIPKTVTDGYLTIGKQRVEFKRAGGN